MRAVRCQPIGPHPDHLAAAPHLGAALRPTSRDIGMALATLLLPAAVLAVSAALSWGADAVGLAVGRYIVAAAAWLSLAVLAAVWLAGGRGLVEFTPGITTAVAPLRLRMDAVVVLFQVAVLVPAALLLTFQSRSSREAAIAGLAAAAALERPRSAEATAEL